MLVLAAVALLCLTAGAAGAWTAYNDVVCRVNQPAPLANVTSWNIGNNHPDPTSGLLKNFATGASVGVTASLTQNTAVSSVVWQSGDAPYPNNTTAGSETNSGCSINFRNSSPSIFSAMINRLATESSAWRSAVKISFALA